MSDLRRCCSAFAALPPADLQAVLADKNLLTKILTYHVIAGQSLDAAQLGAAGEESTVEGDALTFGADGTTVNDAHVVCSDVTTANATVHIIDTVLMPPADEMTGQMSDDMSGSPMGEAMAPSGPACGAMPVDGEGSFAGMADDPAAIAASNNPVLSTLVSAVVHDLRSDQRRLRRRAAG